MILKLSAVHLKAFAPESQTTVPYAVFQCVNKRAGRWREIDEDLVTNLMSLALQARSESYSQQAPSRIVTFFFSLISH